MSEQAVIYLLYFSIILLMMFTKTSWFRCLIGVHVLPMYPDKVVEIGAYKSYAHYKCYACGKEIIK